MKKFIFVEQNGDKTTYVSCEGYSVWIVAFIMTLFRIGGMVGLIAWFI
ncbi:hypothetical protein EDC51_102211 [Bibersteinia trehalosi]|nr:hypothetical protein EDC51_102211 [Bibersteinia trehalosi]